MLASLLCVGLAVASWSCDSGPDESKDVSTRADEELSEPCTPNCWGKVCGDDGCGGTCGHCYTTEGALDDGLCQDGKCGCSPSCAGKQCGPDGCGGTCGVCSGGKICTNGVCQGGCQPNCAGLECGGDGCGGQCGTCAGTDSCQNGKCVAPDPGDCGVCAAGLSCGADEANPSWCSGSGCASGLDMEGKCTGEKSNTVLWCQDGVSYSIDCDHFSTDKKCGWSEEAGFYDCIPICTADCSGKECGDDGCGGSCGTCSGGDKCVNGKCSCAPKSCAGSCDQPKICGFMADGCGQMVFGKVGDDGCGGDCCDCKCPDCSPNCDGKECGDDGCGGSCGSCTAPETCNDDGWCSCSPACGGFLGGPCKPPKICPAQSAGCAQTVWKKTGAKDGCGNECCACQCP